MLDWAQAEAYLNRVITGYAELGWAGSLGLNLILLPLKRRFDSGERTQELFDEIAECE